MYSWEADEIEQEEEEDGEEDEEAEEEEEGACLRRLCNGAASS